MKLTCGTECDVIEILPSANGAPPYQPGAPPQEIGRKNIWRAEGPFYQTETNTEPNNR